MKGDDVTRRVFIIQIFRGFQSFSEISERLKSPLCSQFWEREELSGSFFQFPKNLKEEIVIFSIPSIPPFKFV
jgi:hypothetical protein